MGGCMKDQLIRVSRIPYLYSGVWFFNAIRKSYESQVCIRGRSSRELGVKAKAVVSYEIPPDKELVLVV